MDSGKLKPSVSSLPCNRLPKILLAVFAAIWVVTAIKPKYPQDWLLENLLVFAAVPALVFTWRKFRFSNLSYCLITLFLLLHAIGAHYTYSEVPLGDWLRDHWQLSRNHYDRVVHFSFGLLMGLPLWEILVRVAGFTGGWARVITINTVIAASALYEMLEAIIAHLVSPELGAAYNGTQGDIWDAQKDAALATLGVLICTLISAFRQKPRPQK